MRLVNRLLAPRSLSASCGLSLAGVLAAGVFASFAVQAQVQTSTPVPAQAPAHSAATPAGTAPAAPAVAGKPDRHAEHATEDKARAHVKAQREAERREIEHKRSLIEEQRIDAEKQCYKQFVVEGCLIDVRRAARENDAPLRARELELNESERREQAAKRLKDIEEKTADKAATPMKGQQREGKHGRAAPEPTGPGAKPPVDAGAVQAQRQLEAQARAAKQEDYVRRHAAEVQKRESDQAQNTVKARADYEAKQKAAAERKAKAVQAEKDRTKKPAAPLPPPAP